MARDDHGSAGHHIQLRRSFWRLALAVGLRAAVGAAAVWTGLGISGMLGTVLVIAGALVVLYATALTVFFATARIELHGDQLHIVSALRRRRYRLRRGPVTRMTPRKRRLVDAQVTFLGLMLGQAEVAGEQLAGVLALGPAEYLIAIPTTDGRLAVALQSEDELLGALADRKPAVER